MLKQLQPKLIQIFYESNIDFQDQSVNFLFPDFTVRHSRMNQTELTK
jgi:hypothetical protein